MSNNKNEILINPLGDAALVVQLDQEVSQKVHGQVLNFVNALEKDAFQGFLEAVPTYNNVTVFYDPISVYRAYGSDVSVYETVSKLMDNYIDEIHHSVEREQRCIEIPVFYGGESGPDLEYVARINNLTPEEVIQIHSASDYLVYMIGFAPGFPFLGGMDDRIAAPRKDSPRAAIPSGSVGIAGNQTGIYSLETPGGWQIIGRTPIELFLPRQSPPALLRSGDLLRFMPIDYEEYLNRLERVK